MVKQATKERRKHVRSKRVLSIQYRLAKSSKRSLDKSWGLSTTEDMSLDGLSFYTDMEYRKNDILNIHVIMSGVLDVFKGYGKVIRLDRKKAGVCFLVAIKFVDKNHVERHEGSSLHSVKQYRSQKRV